MGEAWSANLYRMLRVLLGTYVAVHFMHLMPWSAEVFSNRGMLVDAHASPLFGWLPNVLAVSDSPAAVVTLTLTGAVGGVLLALGRFDRIAAVVVVYVLACLYARNPLIANPGLPYVGWMLLAHLAIPPVPRHDASAAVEWRMPRPIYVAAWIVLALSYSYSGYTKLLSPSWVSGDTVALVLQNPLARDHVLRELLLVTPESVLRGVTWAILYVELLFAPLALIPRLRPLLWTIMLGVQLGFLVLLNFADLTAPMLLFHFLTFDPAWIRSKRGMTRETVYYDGACGLCHRLVRFTLAEDRSGHFRYAPLQGSAYADALPADVRAGMSDSIVVVDGAGRLHVKGRAVVHVLHALGGAWRLPGMLLSVLPKRLVDWGYDSVGSVRHRMFARPAGLCPVVPPALRERFQA